MSIKIGNREIGDGHPCFVIAEIGINHNGDISTAMQLIDTAKEAKCDAVKFQIRDVNNLFSREKMRQPKESPWGTTYGEYVRGREFDDGEMGILVYRAIDDLYWGASYWACEPSDEYPAPDFIKVQSVAIRDLDHVAKLLDWDIPMVVSTGGSTIKEIDRAVELLEKHCFAYALMQCNSTYPAKNEELDLAVIETFKQRYGCVVGYSGHELGIAMSTCAVAMGANIIERHITLDRTMWGTDHAASLEPSMITKLVRDIRNLESARGDGTKKIYPGEVEKLRTLGQ